MNKLMNIFVPGILTSLLFGGIFGLNSILDGYGDLKLVAFYVVAFLLIFILMSSLLYLLGILKQIEISIFNSFFLFSGILLTILVFVLTNYFIKVLFKSTGNQPFYSFPRNLSFSIVVLALFLLIKLRKKVIKFASVQSSSQF